MPRFIIAMHARHNSIVGHEPMEKMRYTSGEAVELGDIVDVNGGSGPRCRVVVLIATAEAESGFVASEWSYLKRGVMLQDTKIFGLLHLEEFSAEQTLVHRGPEATKRRSS